jgi:hypothetical protein
LTSLWVDRAAHLEIRPRFEDDDENVRHALAASVAYCREHLGAAPAGGLPGVTIWVS